MHIIIVARNKPMHFIFNLKCRQIIRKHIDNTIRLYYNNIIYKTWKLIYKCIYTYKFFVKNKKYITVIYNNLFSLSHSIHYYIKIYLNL